MKFEKIIIFALLLFTIIILFVAAIVYYKNITINYEFDNEINKLQNILDTGLEIDNIITDLQKRKGPCYSLKCLLGLNTNKNKKTEDEIQFESAEIIENALRAGCDVIVKDIIIKYIEKEYLTMKFIKKISINMEIFKNSIVLQDLVKTLIINGSNSDLKKEAIDRLRYLDDDKNVELFNKSLQISLSCGDEAAAFSAIEALCDTKEGRIIVKELLEKFKSKNINTDFSKNIHSFLENQNIELNDPENQ